jgi:hypothetical protein
MVGFLGSSWTASWNLAAAVALSFFWKATTPSL